MKSFLFSIVAVSLSVMFAKTAHGQSSNNSEIARKIFFQTNLYRASKNLSPLKPSLPLASEALSHSKKMAQGIVGIGHEGFEERVARLKQQIPYTLAAENVGYIKVSSGDVASQALSLWIKSPEHNANLLGDFDLIGIGVASNKRGETFLTQIFLRSKNTLEKSIYTQRKKPHN